MLIFSHRVPTRYVLALFPHPLSPAFPVLTVQPPLLTLLLLFLFCPFLLLLPAPPLLLYLFGSRHPFPLPRPASTQQCNADVQKRISPASR